MKLIAIVTDFHFDEAFPIEQGIDAHKNWQIILDDIKKRNVNQIHIGGDIGEKKSNFIFFSELNYICIPYSLSIGNHDYYDEASKHFFRTNANNEQALYYTEEDETNLFIYLDSSSANISDTQLKWFEEKIQSTKKITVFVHHPILPVNTVVDKLYPLTNRDVLAEMLFKLHQPVTLCCGHYHLEHIQTIKNITQYLTPAVSYQVKPDTEEVLIDNKNFGYRLLLIRNDKIQTECVWFSN